MNRVCERLKEVRSKLNRSASAFARECDIAQRTYSGYENGSRNPSIEFLALIALKFNINLNWLLTQNGEMFFETFDNKRMQKHDISIKSFGERIQKLRAQNLLTIEAFASIIKISPSRLLDIIENGKEPKLSELNAIKSNFNVNIDSLLYGNVFQKPDPYEILAQKLELSPDQKEKLQHFMSSFENAK